MAESKQITHLSKKLCAGVLVATICLCLLAGCARSEPEPAYDVLFYGDSITAGGNFGDYFPDLKVVNLGINGATLEDLTEWVPRVSANRPGKIFVMAGSNNLDYTNVDQCVELF
ncbi:MAG: hypothetical protein J5449_00390, partial [Oscillospiraceae bacterium]|nr:hypothetical protein [Oscillospiraceae bacterium]